MDQKEFNYVISAFKTAHHENEKLHVSDSWQIGVLNLIREESKNDFRASFFDLFQQLVWKLVPVTCVLVLLLGILLIRTDFVSDYEMVKLFVNDPSDLSLFSLYGG